MAMLARCASAFVAKLYCVAQACLNFPCLDIIRVLVDGEDVEGPLGIRVRPHLSCAIQSVYS